MVDVGDSRPVLWVVVAPSGERTDEHVEPVDRGLTTGIEPIPAAAHVVDRQCLELSPLGVGGAAAEHQ